MRTLVLATRNRHKAGEIRDLLGPGVGCLTLDDVAGTPGIAETGISFVENAQLKSRAIAAWLLAKDPDGHPDAGPPWAVLADDSGLEVDALEGAPGVASARFASPLFHLAGNAPDGANNARLLRELASVPADRRQARFRCVLSLTEVTAGLPTRTFEGRCEGRVGWVPRGAHGFGYDPLFLPDGFSNTFAELGSETKNRISHRAKALAAFLEWQKGRSIAL